jgi:hypothetical protein
LLTVTETFAIRGRGVLVAPPLDASEARRERFAVELRTPSGERATVMAFSQIPFFNPPRPVPEAWVTLLGISKDEVPICSEVWTLD